MMSRILLFLVATGVVVAVFLKCVSMTVWATGYDVQNCFGCVPRIDWTGERLISLAGTTAGEENDESIGSSLPEQFQRDGVVVLKQALSMSKVNDLAREVETNMTNTFMTDVLCRLTLPQYKRYEHRIDTRNELLRDWAVYGPFGQWAAELLNVAELRLYNAEIIYSSGNDCSPSWHRDTIAAPFPPTTPAVTFNVYLDDISAEEPHGDALIFLKGSHRDLRRPPEKATNSTTATSPYDEILFEPSLRVGDVLAHHPNVIHTPSGKGCWNRRSLQFRYFSATTPITATALEGDKISGQAPTKFGFDKNRWPHGPIPWSFAHSPELFPHGLKEGDVIAGPAYPLVFPQPLESEHKPLPGDNMWTITKVLEMAKYSQEASLSNNGGPPEGFLTFDGPVLDASEYVTANLPGGVSVPYHKDGPAYRQYVMAGKR